MSAIISPCGAYRYRLERHDVFGDFSIADIAQPLGKPLLSTGKPAKDGHPCHPLMLPYALELQPWRPAL